MPKYVPGSGNATAKLIICGEAPGALEEAQGIPLVGPSGQINDQMLQAGGMSRSEVYVTNIEKYRGPGSKVRNLPSIGISLYSSMPQLWEEIQAINPNCILALGNHALKGLTGKSGIKNYRGSILQCIHPGKWKVVPTYHPANLLPNPEGEFKMIGYEAKVYMQHDYNRAIEESRTPVYDIPEYKYEILLARTSNDVQNFLKESNGRVSVDIESIKSIPVSIAIAHSPIRAMSVPLLNIPGAHGARIPQIELANIWRYLANFLEDPNLEIIGQNWKFDAQKLLRPFGIRTPPPYADTMLLAHTLYPELPTALAFLTSIWTRQPFYKSDLEEFHFTGDLDTLLRYNAFDVLVTYEIFNRLIAEAESREV